MNRDELQEQAAAIVAVFMRSMAAFVAMHEATVDEDGQSNAAWLNEVGATTEQHARDLLNYIWD